MRRIATTAVAILAGFLVFSSCQPTQRVHASSEDDSASHPIHTAIAGDLYAVDVARKTLAIRVENGMAQTFRWDNSTAVDGLPADTAVSLMKQLSRCPGSELNVEWQDFNGEKLATVIHIQSLMQPSTPSRRTKSRHSAH